MVTSEIHGARQIVQVPQTAPHPKVIIIGRTKQGEIERRQSEEDITSRFRNSYSVNIERRNPFVHSQRAVHESPLHSLIGRHSMASRRRLDIPHTRRQSMA
eukprot:Gregarina_sp_Poly_1__11401@NODE_96_length_14647_cov_152_270302_g83_i0_p18_GENE_NODE_96_length_14647_cov_152_270302_g83_i0NODE_96_length_14647_cov_152_270302_g83_i0_p18_ORF_typecomplete_len101_score5_03_NODE_96_length_14647_cov_152_270302_g83_i042714573